MIVTESRYAGHHSVPLTITTWTMADNQKQIALVTGGNGGIGYEICVALAAAGNFHVLLGSRSIDKGKKAISDLKDSNSSASISLLQLDVTSDDSIRNAVEHTESTYGRLDCLINNAGIISSNNNPREAMRETFETNSISPALMTTAFADLLRKSPLPRLIYVSSSLGSITIQSDISNPTSAVPYPPYRMSKAALNMLVANTAFTYAKDGFKCFAFCPGYVISDLAGQREFKEKTGAGDPMISGQGVLKIAQGLRDGEAGLFLHCGLSGPEGDGVFPW